MSHHLHRSLLSCDWQYIDSGDTLSLPVTNVLGEKYNDQKPGFLAKTRRVLVPSTNTMCAIKLFPDPDLMSQKLAEVTFCNLAA